MSYIENKNIKFERGSILTKNIIQNIYDYPRDLINIMYSNYPDGIIKGLEIHKKDNNIFLSKGILKYDNEYFFLKENLDMESLFNNLNEGTSYAIYFENKGECKVEDNFISHKLELKIISCDDYKKLDNSKVFFLGEFTYNDETKIKFPNELIDLKKKRHSCFNNINVNYSGYKENTFCPNIGQLILNHLKLKKNISPLDFTLMCELSKEQTLSYETICFYIKNVINKDVYDLSREEVFDFFVDSLDKPYEVNAIIKEPKKEVIKEKFKIEPGLL